MPIFIESFIYSRIRKWRRFLLFLLLASVSLFGWMRLTESIKVYTILIQLGINPHPLYFVISGGLIGILFIIAWITRLTKPSWSIKYIRVCIIFLGILFIIEHMILSKNQSGVFSTAIELLVIVVIFLLPENPSGNTVSK
jgi:hypothetical protein